MNESMNEGERKEKGGKKREEGKEGQLEIVD